MQSRLRKFSDGFAFIVSMQMKEKFLYAGSFLSLLASTHLLAADANKPSRPNVIIICADDLGYGDLECYHAKNIHTPAVNSVAQYGILFSNAYAVASTSTPSRYSLLTGEYAWRKKGTDVAAGDAGMIIDPGQYTLADVFKNEGYATSVIGKWHLGLGRETGKQDWNAPLPMHPGDLGFDYSYIMAATADRVPCVFIENGKVANYDPAHPIEVSYTKPFPGEPLGVDHPELMYNLQPTHEHNKAIVNGIGRFGYMKGGGKALWKDENIADSITAHAIGFIRQHSKEPFFMYFATNDVHVPRFPHERFRGKNVMGLRGDAIAQFDWSVGQLLACLEELKLRDNTLIILTSDNGPVCDDGYDDKAAELLNGHSPTGGLRGNKYSAFEGGTRIPFIVSWPAGMQKAGTSAALVSQIDLMRSMGELLGAILPKGSAPDSENQLNVLLGKDADGREWVVEQSYNHTLSVRTKDWKYIEPNDGPAGVPWVPEIESGNSISPQLYKISDDSCEQQNVAIEHPEVVFKMQDVLRKLRKGGR